MSDCVNEFIDNLPPDYKTVIVLSELEGLANKEIAEILDLSLDNVKIRLHRARTKLKAALNEDVNFTIMIKTPLPVIGSKSKYYLKPKNKSQ